MAWPFDGSYQSLTGKPDPSGVTADAIIAAIGGTSTDRQAILYDASGPTLIFGDVAAGGTDVVANPTGGPFVRDLTAVRIDGLDYNVAGSGGGSADGVAETASFAQSADKLSTTMTPARAAWPQ